MTSPPLLMIATVLPSGMPAVQLLALCQSVSLREPTHVVVVCADILTEIVKSNRMDDIRNMYLVMSCILEVGVWFNFVPLMYQIIIAIAVKLVDYGTSSSLIRKDRAYHSIFNNSASIRTKRS